ncbi:UbiA prenyltransferase family protein [Rugamonas aquatica]|uniref:Uncharacterized protein n=1 Tax=Rugamonas aquatica TaxID=2743357 RepID=A0A6A7N5I9_9BURK|nr:hypothetical protein [Rugamonas aquatica]MQA40354.1 hypothetical protein [Rugamonas aquatica]
MATTGASKRPQAADANREGRLNFGIKFMKNKIYQMNLYFLCSGLLTMAILGFVYLGKFSPGLLFGPLAIFFANQGAVIYKERIVDREKYEE